MPDDQHPHDPPPPRGADPVDDELEVGYDLAFERSWHHAELAGRVVIALVVAAGLAGLLGRGPFSHHTASADHGSLRVDFEPVARFGTPTQVTLHVRPPPEQPREVDLRLSSSLVEPLGLQSVEPRPVRSWSEQGDLVVRLALPQGEAESLVRLLLRPSVVGPQWLTAEVGSGTALHWTQWIMP